MRRFVKIPSCAPVELSCTKSKQIHLFVVALSSRRRRQPCRRSAVALVMENDKVTNKGNLGRIFTPLVGSHDSMKLQAISGMTSALVLQCSWEHLAACQVVELQQEVCYPD